MREKEPLVVCSVVALICLLTLNVFALDGNYGVEPIEDYDPCTATSTPFFPIGWYFAGIPETGCPDCNDLAVLAASNANTVLLEGFGTSGAELTAMAAALDEAETLGLKLVLSFDVDAASSPYTEIVSFVAAFKNHPALLAWQVGYDNDQTDSATVTKVNDIIAAIDAEDGNNQIWQVHGAGENPSALNASGLTTNTDVFSRYHFVLETGDAQFNGSVDPSVDGMNELVGAHNTVAADLTGGAYGAGNIFVTQAFGYDGYRMPDTWDNRCWPEFRYSVLSSLASAGCKGVMAYQYDKERIATYDTSYDAYMWSELRGWTEFFEARVTRLYHELGMLSHAMAGATGSYDVGTVTSTYDSTVPGQNFKQVSTLLLYDDQEERYYLIVTHNRYQYEIDDTTSSPQDPLVVELTLSNLPHPITSAVAWETGEDVAVDVDDLGNGSYKITDGFGYYSCRVYVLCAKTGGECVKPDFYMSNMLMHETFEDYADTVGWTGDGVWGQVNGTSLAISSSAGRMGKGLVTYDADARWFNHLDHIPHDFGVYYLSAEFRMTEPDNYLAGAKLVAERGIYSGNLHGYAVAETQGNSIWSLRNKSTYYSFPAGLDSFQEDVWYRLQIKLVKDEQAFNCHYVSRIGKVADDYYIPGDGWKPVYGPWTPKALMYLWSHKSMGLQVGNLHMGVTDFDNVIMAYGDLGADIIAQSPTPPANCGDFGTYYYLADYNKDCSVDLSDFAEFAGQWNVVIDPNSN